MLYIIYADLECLIKKIDECANDPEKSSTTKIGEHIPCRYLMSTIWGFDHIEDVHTLHHGKDNANFFKRKCEKYNRIWKEENDSVNKKANKNRTKMPEYAIFFYFLKDFFKANYQKVIDHCHYTGKYRDEANSIFNLEFSVPN